MPSEPRWISVEDIAEINRLAVQQTDEPFLIRDMGLLQSAWANPQNRWHYEGVIDVVTLAVGLMLAIARNHPFAQGNKRTGFATADTFLYLNGYDMGVADYSELGDLIIQALIGEITEDDLISILAYSVHPSA